MTVVLVKKTNPKFHDDDAQNVHAGKSDQKN
jgi:hypothetical protein